MSLFFLGCVPFLPSLVRLSCIHQHLLCYGQAIRAIRHPERYGPRAADPTLGGSAGQAQSRARGLTRAIVDTFPVIKFTRVVPGSQDGEDVTGMGAGATAEDDRKSMADLESGRGRGSGDVAIELKDVKDAKALGVQDEQDNGDGNSEQDARGEGGSTEGGTSEDLRVRRRSASTTVADHGPIDTMATSLHQSVLPKIVITNHDDPTSPVAVPGAASSPTGESPLPSHDAPISASESTSLQTTPTNRPTHTTRPQSEIMPAAIGRDTCPICILDFEEGDDLRILPCEGKHVFHQECVDPWLLELSSSCPICRQGPSIRVHLDHVR